MSDDPIMKIALTARRQSPEMEMLEWSDDKNGYAKAIIHMLYCALSVVVFTGIASFFWR